jgi:hypothetical protein
MENGPVACQPAAGKLRPVHRSGQTGPNDGQSVVPMRWRPLVRTGRLQRRLPVGARLVVAIVRTPGAIPGPAAARPPSRRQRASNRSRRPGHACTRCLGWESSWRGVWQPIQPLSGLSLDGLRPPLAFVPTLRRGAWFGTVFSLPFDPRARRRLRPCDRGLLPSFQPGMMGRETVSSREALPIQPPSWYTSGRSGDCRNARFVYHPQRRRDDS